MRAWLFQDARQKQKLRDDAPWSVGWYDPDGKKRSKRIGTRSKAETYQRKIEGPLAAGTYEGHSRKRWSDFRKEYEQKIQPRLAGPTKRLEEATHFERIVRPAKVAAITTQTVDEYVAKRRAEPGKKPESKVSPATVNRELRHLKAIFRVAHDWGYLPKVPKVRMLKEPKKLPRYVTPEDFGKIYDACDVARFPKGLPYAPSDWWRALLVFSYMTG